MLSNSEMAPVESGSSTYRLPNHDYCHMGPEPFPITTVFPLPKPLTLNPKPYKRQTSILQPKSLTLTLNLNSTPSTLTLNPKPGPGDTALLLVRGCFARQNSENRSKCALKFRGPCFFPVLQIRITKPLNPKPYRPYTLNCRVEWRF